MARSGTRPPCTPLDLLLEPAAVEDQTPFEVVPAPEVRGASLRPDADRRFDLVITHDRDLVVRAAQPLLDRLLPAS